MTYNDIRCFSLLNEVDEDKVNSLVESMLENGWIGCPILVLGESLLTGSHRLAALNKIHQMYLDDIIDDASVLDEDIAENIIDIYEEKYQKFEEENGYAPEIEYDRIGWILEGTWVEEYKDEISEW